MNIFIFKPHIHDCVRASCAQAMSRKKTNPSLITNTMSTSSGNANQSNMILIFNEPSVNIEYELERMPHPYFLVHSLVYSRNEFLSVESGNYLCVNISTNGHSFFSRFTSIALFILNFGQRIYFHFYRCCFDYTLNVRTSVCVYK